MQHQFDTSSLSTKTFGVIILLSLYIQFRKQILCFTYLSTPCPTISYQTRGETFKSNLTNINVMNSFKSKLNIIFLPLSS